MPNLAGMGNDVEGTIRRVAGEYRFPDPDLLVATARQESRLNPLAVGDQGQSYGVFQEHSKGRGAGIPVESRQDVAAATARAIREFEAIRQRNPAADRGTWAALAQRPLDAAGYARSINALLGQAPQGGQRGATVGGTAPAQGAPPGQSVAGDTATQGAPGRVPEWWGLVGGVADGGAPPAPPRAAPAAAAGGADVWPVAGREWGDVLNPFGGKQYRAAGATVSLPSSNVGVDLRGKIGEPIVAPRGGQVVAVYDAKAEHDPNENYGWGGSVVIRGDNGYYYRLSHQKPGSIAVQPGQTVTPGQYLGQIGISGNSSTPHVDVEKFRGSGPLANDRQYADFAAGKGVSQPAPTGAGHNPPAGRVPEWWALVQG